jgi:hypothetical protein
MPVSSLPEGKYYWRVDAINSIDTTYGAVFSFEIREKVVSFNDHELEKWAVYPNPADTGLYFENIGNGEKEALVTIRSITGKVICSKYIPKSSQPVFYWDLSKCRDQISGGFYFVSLRFGKDIETFKVQLL